MENQHNHQTTKPKIVWVVSDGIPGHFNQSKGIILALESQCTIKVYWFEAHLKYSFYRRVLSFFLNRIILNIQLLSWFYKFESFPVESPDMVIGAGGKSAYAVAWLAQHYQAKSIFSGSLRQLKSSLFDAVLVLEPNLPPPFIGLPTAPMPINQHKLQMAAHAWQTSHLPAKTKRWALLIGGNGAGAQYQIDDWQQLALQLNALAEQHNVQWLISTSRRTGAMAEQVLKQTLNPIRIDDAIWWSEEQRPALAAFLGLSEVVFCTVDSMSMVMEAITAMRPVVVLQPEIFNPEQKYALAMNCLEQKKIIQRLAIHQLLHDLHYKNLQPLSEEPSLKLGRLLVETIKCR